MMSMLKLEEYYRAVVDCWRLFRQFHAPQKSEAYWQELHSEAHRIYDLHGKKIFVKQLIFVMLDEIDRRYDRFKGGMER